MSDWNCYTSHAVELADPPAGVLTSLLLLQTQAKAAEKIRQENVKIATDEAIQRKEGIIRPEPRFRPGPYKCTSCGSRPWHPLLQNLCNHCGLQVALKNSWKAAGCSMPYKPNNKVKADSDDNDEAAPNPKMNYRAKKACGKADRGQPRQCPKCYKKTWEHMPLGTCDGCGMQEAMNKSWKACHKDKNGPEQNQDSAKQTNQQSWCQSSDPRQTAASSSWQAPQLQAPWRYEPPPGLSASSSSQAPSGIIRTTSRHNKIPSTQQDP